ncbi:hypothetical protein OEZ86_013596 [Tetradesmus obliquus]|nr:hypothetical protein OEZ86_013596 [Tetradesmus obliquus]
MQHHKAKRCKPDMIAHSELQGRHACTAIRCKPDMIAHSELRGQHAPQVDVHGHIPGVAVGDSFGGRGPLAMLGLHCDMMKGIMARVSNGKAQPAYAICLAGGYKDDADSGATFWYTGEGGQKAGMQVKDQSYNSPGNAALLASFDTNTPVRVFRSKAVKKVLGEWCPPGYNYEGLYRVLQHRMVESADGSGFKVIQYEMQGVPGHSVVSHKVEFRWRGRASFQQRQLAEATAKPGRKRSRTSAKAKAIPLPKVLSRAEVEALIQQAAAAGGGSSSSSSSSSSKGRLVTADISGGLEKLPISVWNAVDEDDRILIAYVPAAAAAASTADGSGAAAAAAAADAGPAAVDSAGDGAQPAAAAAAAAGLPAAGDMDVDAAAAAAAAAECTAVDQADATAGSSEVAAAAAAAAAASAAAPAEGDAADDAEMVDAQPKFVYISDYTFDSDPAVQELIQAARKQFQKHYKGICGTKFKGDGKDCENYNEHGQLVYTLVSGHMECESASCKVTGLCKYNHVVSNGIRYPLEVFKVSAEKGWGVRCSCDLPPGAFVCSYIGKVITDEAADALQPGVEDLYLFDLSHYHDAWEGHALNPKETPMNKNLKPLEGQLAEKHLVVDAGSTGNVARFLNHSCDPNCIKQTVFAGQARSQLLYYTSFFTERAVPAGQELTYDYGENYHTKADGAGGRLRFPCQCGAANCTGNIAAADS